MKARPNPFRIAYQLAITAIWIMGVFLSILAVLEIIDSSHGHDQITPSIFSIIFALLAIFTIFSFLKGAQPGHWVRAISIILYTGYTYCMKMAYGDELRMERWSHIGWVFMITLIVINAIWARRFKEMFAIYGYKNFFSEYFPNQ